MLNWIVSQGSFNNLVTDPESTVKINRYTSLQRSGYIDYVFIIKWKVSLYKSVLKWWSQLQAVLIKFWYTNNVSYKCMFIIMYIYIHNVLLYWHSIDISVYKPINLIFISLVLKICVFNLLHFWLFTLFAVKSMNNWKGIIEDSFIL